jgi:hypothetical protein
MNGQTENKFKKYLKKLSKKYFNDNEVKKDKMTRWERDLNRYLKRNLKELDL